MLDLLTTVTNTVQNTQTEHTLSTTPSLFRLGLSFIVLMGALWFVIWILKKLSGSKLKFFNHDSNIKILETKALSPKTQLYIIEHEGKKMLIAESSSHVKFKDFESTTIED